MSYIRFKKLKSIEHEKVPMRDCIIACIFMTCDRIGTVNPECFEI